MLDLTQYLNSEWRDLLASEFEKPYMAQLTEFLATEIAAGKTILPEPQNWFNALNSTSLENIKVVIIGQDPYPTLGHAHGLSFSVMPELKPLPKSLLNINKELESDLGVLNHHTGYLQPWAEQGVLLLNAVLTVEAGNANAHQNQGWEAFTNAVIELINQKTANTVFILWGAYAQKKAKQINQTKHLILKSPHPSPLSAYRGFFGSQPFSKTNQYLKENRKKTINWQL